MITPNWDLLPAAPIRFFELEPAFDRKDLKRAYTKLIRVYKPERHPNEFQRIREAYDSLDERLRYLGTTERIVVETGQEEPTGAQFELAEFPAPPPELDALQLSREKGIEATVAI